MFVSALPFSCAVLTGTLLASVLPSPRSPADVVLVTALVVAASSAAYAFPQRAGRRLLPLAALLDLTLVFPDVTPSRFSLALRAQSPRKLTQQIYRSFEPEPTKGRPKAPRAQVATELVGLLAALTVHDPRTRGHSERVRAYTTVIAEELQLDDDARNRLAWAALLHDIGKIGVPRDVLSKVGGLTDEEWALVKAHTVIGDRLVRPLAEWLGEFASVPLQHHERWDGRGYPAGLAGEDISLGARIVAVADAYDVMTSVRSYQRSRDPESARHELVACAGQQFDPVVVRAFLNAGLRPASVSPAAYLPLATLTAMIDAVQVRWRLRPLHQPGVLAAAGGAVVAAGLSGLLPVQPGGSNAVAGALDQGSTATTPALVLPATGDEPHPRLLSDPQSDTSTSMPIGSQLTAPNPAAAGTTPLPGGADGSSASARSTSPTTSTSATVPGAPSSSTGVPSDGSVTLPIAGSVSIPLSAPLSLPVLGALLGPAPGTIPAPLQIVPPLAVPPPAAPPGTVPPSVGSVPGASLPSLPAPSLPGGPVTVPPSTPPVTTTPPLTVPAVPAPSVGSLLSPSTVLGAPTPTVPSNVPPTPAPTLPPIGPSGVTVPSPVNSVLPAKAPAVSSVPSTTSSLPAPAGGVLPPAPPGIKAP